jgi:hypothetical protein
MLLYPCMRGTLAAAGALIAAVLFGPLTVFPASQVPAERSIRPLDETALREYAGVYQWAPNAFVYLQLWNEFVGFDKPSALFAFDESGEVRMLYPGDRDRFFSGKGVTAPARFAR